MTLTLMIVIVAYIVLSFFWTVAQTLYELWSDRMNRK